MYDTTSMREIIEIVLNPDTLPKIPRKIKMSYNAYQLLNSMLEKKWITSIEDETWDGIPVEIDMDLFGYTYEIIYEEKNHND